MRALQTRAQVYRVVQFGYYLLYVSTISLVDAHSVARIDEGQFVPGEGASSAPLDPLRNAQLIIATDEY